MSILSYEKWCEVNEQDHLCEMAELGCDREPDFNMDNWLEVGYEVYIRSCHANEVEDDLDTMVTMLRNAQSSARIYRQKFIDCSNKNTCTWTHVSGGYKSTCDVITETRVTGDSDMLMIFCPFCGGYINEVTK